MAKRSHPRRGSLAYSPRKRAKSETARISAWPEISEGPRIQDFAGYKAGMTHALMVDYRKHSNTSGMEVHTPATVIEVPPLRVAGIRFYENTSYGLKTLTEVWAKKQDKYLSRRLPVPRNPDMSRLKEIDPADVDEVRLIVYTQPSKLTGVPKKVPDVMEMRVGGGSIQERIDYAKDKLGKELKIEDFVSPGHMVDVVSVTTGRGFTGHRKRWGVKLLSHKNSKHRRMIATLGPKSPGYVRPTVPQAGQKGYHQRTEFNKRVLKIGKAPEEDSDDINPAGGFVNYGLVRNPYVLIHGSVPGPSKRLVRFRDPMRFHGKPIDSVDIPYVSTESQQGD